jgi:hypothetical protein
MSSIIFRRARTFLPFGGALDSILGISLQRYHFKAKNFLLSIKVYVAATASRTDL